MRTRNNAVNRIRKSALLLLLSISPIFRLAAQTVPPIMSSWAPVTDADKQANSSTIDPEAGVEALFWRVYVSDEWRGDELLRVTHNYIRLKVFNEKGKADASTINIDIPRDSGIPFLHGRTIKADGTIIDLKRDAVFERDLTRAGGIKRRVKSFAMPAVEPGAIIEYRWQEVKNHPNIWYIRMNFQTDYPVRNVTYYLRPLSRQDTGLSMAVWPFNCQPSHLKLEMDGSNSTFVENVPAFKYEPLMPGDANIRAWSLAFYTKPGQRDPRKYWDETGKAIYKNLREALKVNSEIKEAADKATAKATTEEEKVLALIRYIRTNLHSVFSPAVSDADRAQYFKKAPKGRSRTSAEVMKAGMGTDNELNTLFAAMASYLGLDARPILLPNRAEVRFEPSMADEYFLRGVDMAVKFGENWKIYDVAATRLAPTMLSWQEEGSAGLLADPKKPDFILSPFSPPSASQTKRQGTFKLAADGTLEGDATCTFSGHVAEEEREDLFSESAERQVESVKADLVKLYPAAEITNIKVQNAAEPEKDLIWSYHIKIPAYGERTGKRIFFQPDFFQRGSKPLFPAAKRLYNIQFRYAFEEHDDVTITMPEGYSLEEPENPGDLKLGKPGSYGLKMGVAGQRFHCVRDFVFGNEGALDYAREIYPNLKVAFDEINRRDNQTLSLRQGAAPQAGATK